VNKTISREDRQKLDGPIRSDELELAVQQLNTNKSPGVDGIPSEFYQEFWPLIKHKYLSYINEVQNTSLDDWKNMSITTLIYKNKGSTDELANYRPISLINVDVKIITKVLTNRLKTVLPTVIHHSQTAVDGRFIDNTVHMIRDLIQIANDQQIEACFIFLDQEKAFDRVDRDFLYKIMSAFGVGETFINWIRLIYSNASTKVNVNGFLTEKIPLKRGVRQGDPLSFYEYIFVNEILALQLRNNPNIVGFQIEGEKIVSQHYADDTTISITQNRCFKEVYKELEEYEEATGAKVNYTKTKALWTGLWTNRTDTPLPIQFTNKNVKNLGVYFGNDDPAKATFLDILPKIQKSMDFWKPLKFCKLAKARIIEIFHASRLWYAASFYTIPQFILKQLQTSFNEYINFPWKQTTVAQLETRKLRKDGGLKAIDIQLKSAASKIHYLVKLCTREDLKLNLSVTTELLGTQPFSIRGTDIFFTPQQYTSSILRTKSNFYKEAIKSLSKFNLTKKITNIAEEHLYYNRALQINRQNRYTHVTQSNLQRRVLQTYGQVQAENNNRTNGTPYITPITNLYDKITVQTKPTNHHLMTIQNKEYTFHQITIKLLYETLLVDSYKEHHYKEKWHNKFNPNLDWQDIWSRVHNKISFEETKSAIWEQLHLNSYTQYCFNKWNQKQDNCRLCREIPLDRFHLILDCKFTKTLWQDLEPALNEIYRIQITEEEMAFGLKGKSPEIQLRNWLTFVLKETIIRIELRAYYNEQYLDNLDETKQKYNEKINQYISLTYETYRDQGRYDIFIRFFCINNSLVTTKNEDEIEITLPFAITPAQSPAQTPHSP